MSQSSINNSYFNVIGVQVNQDTKEAIQAICSAIETNSEVLLELAKSLSGKNTKVSGVTVEGDNNVRAE